MESIDEKYPIGRPGYSKLFHVETMRRVPVEQDQTTKDTIGRTSHEGRIFPQALSDEFGKIAQVARIKVVAVPKKLHFGAAEEDEILLEIYILGDNDETLHRFLVNISDLEHVHRSGWHSFRAGETAVELVRLFRQVTGL